MRIFALLLAGYCFAAASARSETPAKLTEKDESAIRAIIQDEAKKENQKNSGEVWSERGPTVYRVRQIEAVTADVATAEVHIARTGVYLYGPNTFLFILTRTDGRWSVSRRVAMFNGAFPPTAQPPSGAP
jgi:hypothetical protein